RDKISCTSMSAVSMPIPITRARRSTMALGPVLGARLRCSSRAFSICWICSRTSRRRSKSRCSSANVLAGMASPSGVRRDCRRSAAFLSFGLNPRMPRRVKATLARLGIRGFNPKLKNAAERLQSLRTPEGEAIPANTLAELQRDFERRRLVLEQIQQIEKARLEHLKRAPKTRPNAMVLLLARVIGIGIETADMLVQEILSRNLRDRRAVARYGGLTGSPDASGNKRREKGLSQSGNARVRRGMVLLAWRFLKYQKDS